MFDLSQGSISWTTLFIKISYSDYHHSSCFFCLTSFHYSIFLSLSFLVSFCMYCASLLLSTDLISYLVFQPFPFSRFPFHSHKYMTLIFVRKVIGLFLFSFIWLFLAFCDFHSLDGYLSDSQSATSLWLYRLSTRGSIMASHHLYYRITNKYGLPL
jgi:apolipoprotein N-acyltransferase